MKRISKILVVATITVISAAAFGFYRYNMPVAKTGHRPVDFTVSSDELYGAFEMNEAASNEKYLDKVILVKGTINDIQQEQDGSIGVILDGGGMVFGVSCRFEKEQAASVSTLESGQDITVKGICTGMLSDVVLIRCVLDEDQQALGKI